MIQSMAVMGMMYLKAEKAMMQYMAVQGMIR